MRYLLSALKFFQSRNCAHVAKLDFDTEQKGGDVGFPPSLTDHSQKRKTKTYYIIDIALLRWITRHIKIVNMLIMSS